MSLATGNRVHSNQWTILPLDDEVIERVHELAKIEAQPKISSNFKFECRIDGEDIGTPEENEVVNDEDDTNELLLPMDIPEPEIIDVDEESVESGASNDEESNMDYEHEELDEGENILVTDEEDSKDRNVAS